MAYLKVAAAPRGQTKAGDILQIYPDALFLTKKKKEWMYWNYTIKVSQTVAELKILLTKPEESNGTPIGDENRHSVKIDSLGLSDFDKGMIQNNKAESPVSNTEHDFNLVVEDKEAK